MEPLTQADLRGARCTTPGCTCDSDSLVLTPGCHDGAPTIVEYRQDTGVLNVRCALCSSVICRIAVAAGVSVQ